MPQMNEKTAAKCLSELGSPTRLAVYRLLVRAGPEGMVVGDLQRHLKVPGSTLSHHIARLTWAGLVEQRRQGRQLHCICSHDVMGDLLAFLTEECCTGFGEDCAGQPAA